VKKRPLFYKRQLSMYSPVSLVAVVGFGCSVQVCKCAGASCGFSVSVSVAAFILLQAREQF
jgi:hypothetical protein